MSETLYTCYTNGELDDFHWTCACCKSMFPTLDNIATTLQDLHLKSDTRMTKIEERMNKKENNTKEEIKESVTSMKEEILESVKEGLDKMVDARNRELEDRRRRDLNLTMFNLPEPNEENSAANKQADEQAFKIICRRLGLEEVNVMSSFRLGKKSENKTRPIKLILSDKSHRKFIIENAKHIPRKVPTLWQRVVITKDLTPLQRKERKERFEQRKQRQPQPSGSNDQSNSPRPMEVQDREPSPIRNVLQHDLSHVNATPGSQQTGTAYNEQTLLDNTVLGGLPISVEDDPGSPV